MLTIGNKNRGQFVHVFANAIQQKSRTYRKVNKTESAWIISQAALNLPSVFFDLYKAERNFQTLYRHSHSILFYNRNIR